MKRFLAGVAAGVILGAAIASTVSARADVGSYFVSVSSIYQRDESFQNGYIAGVYDATEVLAEVASRGPIDRQVLYNIGDCLDRQGDKLTQFAIYAGNALRRSSSTSIAAADPILAACVRQ